MTYVRFLTITMGLCLPTAGRADDKAATPEALVEKLHAARTTGDLKAELSLIGGPHRALVGQAFDILQAAVEFDRALDDRFGKDPACRSEFVPRLGRVLRVELK